MAAIPSVRGHISAFPGVPGGWPTSRVSAPAATSLRVSANIDLGAAPGQAKLVAAEGPDGAVFYADGQVVMVVDGNGPPQPAEHPGAQVLGLGASSATLYVVTPKALIAYGRSTGNQSGRWALPGSPATSRTWTPGSPGATPSRSSAPATTPTCTTGCGPTGSRASTAGRPRCTSARARPTTRTPGRPTTTDPPPRRQSVRYIPFHPHIGCVPTVSARGYFRDPGSKALICGPDDP